MPLATLFSRYLPAIENELRAVVAGGDPALAEFYEMLNYHMGWVEHGQGPVVSGKRIRPLLTLLTCSAAGGAAERALPAAAAVEFIHNFSLIHDDIQDNSPERRGRPTVWKLWGQPQAINAGDALFTLAHLALQRLAERGHSAQTSLIAMSLLDETCLRLTQGQHLDMAFESRESVTVADYMQMIESKTGSLIAASAELGALCAGADEAARAQYRAFGLCLGLAFQVRDDILGIWGDSAVTGKSAATDIVTRKKSLPIVYGLERNESLRRLYAPECNGGGSVGEIVRALEVTGARDYAEAEEGRLSETALTHLAEAKPEAEAAVSLRQLTGELLGRRQ
ncbi:MAG: polyprenyl synthetase family protein [Chloroflexi bacterium]|nr:polyprenyl synthetase family protein [Chloroflexota bacterium]